MPSTPRPANVGGPSTRPPLCLPLRDRNDLNASPALGTTGIYIASESGAIWYVPYDYCLHVHDPRCAVGPGGTFEPDTTSVYLMTPGGLTETATTVPVAPESVLPLRLVVRRDGIAVDARFEAQNPPTVTLSPPVRFSTTLMLLCVKRWSCVAGVRQ